MMSRPCFDTSCSGPRNAVTGFSATLLAFTLGLCAPAAAQADALEDLERQVKALAAIVEAQQQQLDAQAAELTRVRAKLDRQQETDAVEAAQADADAGRDQKHETPRDQGAYGLPKELAIETSDGRYGMRFGGTIQLRGEILRDSGDDTSTRIDFRRLRPIVSGHVHDPALTYRIMPELAGESASLRDAWIDYAAHPRLHIRAGQFAAPFHWHRFISSSRQHFTERSQSSEQFGWRQGRDKGVMLHGRNVSDTLFYAAGVFDGAGRNSSRFSTGAMLSGRIGWAVLGSLPAEESDLEYSKTPQLALGAGIQGAWRNETRAWDLGRSLIGNHRADVLGGTMDAAFRWRGVSLAADAHLRRVRPDDPFVARYHGWAYTVSGGVFVAPRKLEVVARWTDLALERRDDDTRVASWGLGLNWYHRGHDLKTQLNFLKDNGSGAENIILQHHVAF